MGWQPEPAAIAHGRFDELMYEASGNAALQRLGHQTRPLMRAFIQARVNGTGQLQRLADETNCILQAVARRASQRGCRSLARAFHRWYGRSWSRWSSQRSGPHQPRIGRVNAGDDRRAALARQA
jgi:DNA-binding GntR family transcriptional regulator